MIFNLAGVKIAWFGNTAREQKTNVATAQRKYLWTFESRSWTRTLNLNQCQWNFTESQRHWLKFRVLSPGDKAADEQITIRNDGSILPSQMGPMHCVISRPIWRYLASRAPSSNKKTPVQWLFVSIANYSVTGGNDWLLLSKFKVYAMQKSILRVTQRRAEPLPPTFNFWRRSVPSLSGRHNTRREPLKGEGELFICP